MPLPKLSRLRVSSRIAPGDGVRPVGSPVPDHMPPPGWAGWLAQIALAVNSAMAGKINVVLDVELAPDTATTTIFDTRIGVWSVILPMARQANTPATIATLWFEVGQGSCVLHHSIDPEYRGLRIAILG